MYFAMEEQSENRRRCAPEKAESSFLNSFCMAALGFLFVVITHQLLLGFMSRALGYETQITFGSVISKPFDNRYWSTSRVLAMYLLPSLAYLSLAGFLALYLLFISQKVNRLYWFLFWIMTFSVLIISTQFTLAPIGAFISKGAIYQGVSVVANWWGIDSFKLLSLSFLSLLLNILFGIISFKMIIQLSPARSTLKSRSQQRVVIWVYFIIPIVLLLPVAVFLAYPDSILVMTVMLLHAVFWLPGLFMKSYAGYRYEGKITQASETSTTNYGIVALLVLALILTRIFL